MEVHPRFNFSHHPTLSEKQTSLEKCHVYFVDCKEHFTKLSVIKNIFTYNQVILNHFIYFRTGVSIILSSGSCYALALVELAKSIHLAIYMA